jgi:hypothetical protein
VQIDIRELTCAKQKDRLAAVSRIWSSEAKRTKVKVERPIIPDGGSMGAVAVSAESLSFRSREEVFALINGW